MLVTTKERILHYIECKNIPKSKFYNDLGIKRGLLDSDKLKASVTDVVIAKILAIYKDLNINWLLTGEATFFVRSPKKKTYRWLIHPIRLLRASL